MSKRRRSHHRRKIKHSPPGSAPGIIFVPEDALELKVRTMMYNEGGLIEKDITSVSEITQQLNEHPGSIHWFDVRGLGDKAFLEKIAETFGILRLQMEDVVNVYQRPKMEENAGYIFFISRVIHKVNLHVQTKQLSLFIGKNYVITFQDSYEDVLDPVRSRIRHGKGAIRKSGADYLAYSLMDVVVDNYYPVLDQIGERLDELQDELLVKPTRETLDTIIDLKRDLIAIRRLVWSERDKLNDILRSELVEIGANAKLYFRDTYDHCIQLLDLVESYREVTASLMDVYHSSISNRLNGVMKVLTIISTIFIPLTFIVGLYGMNFSRKDPETGQFLPMNMPELYSPYGYIGVIVVMVLIVILQLIFYYRKGWLDKG
jgi:magnesium transporter